MFDDAIIDNEMSMNDTTLFTMSSLYLAKEDENNQYWMGMKSSQLDAVYSCLQDTEDVPPREAVERVRRSLPLAWSPRDSLTQYQHQSRESFEEQQRAIDLIQRQIDRYRSAGKFGAQVCLKNPAVHGAPGAGKTFVGSVAVLYALS